MVLIKSLLTVGVSFVVKDYYLYAVKSCCVLELALFWALSSLSGSRTWEWVGKTQRRKIVSGVSCRVSGHRRLATCLGK